jgi:NADH-quinone oxidoreductase subunit L
LSDALAARFPRAYELSRDKFRFDEAYDAGVVRPTLVVAELSRIADNWIVDGLVRLVAWLPGFMGRVLLRPIQNGLVQFYALSTVCCLVVFMLFLWLRG